eukprot:4556043-Pyramimonas_sp.AAC.1
MLLENSGMSLVLTFWCTCSIPPSSLSARTCRRSGLKFSSGGEVSVKCSEPREPRNPTESEEHQRHPQGVLYGT